MQIELRGDGREIKSHGDYSFPTRDLVLLVPRPCQSERLDAYEMGSFACHWHPEIEFTLILDGEILYQINDRTLSPERGGRHLLQRQHAAHRPARRRRGLLLPVRHGQPGPPVRLRGQPPADEVCPAPDGEPSLPRRLLLPGRPLGEGRPRLPRDHSAAVREPAPLL